MRLSICIPTYNRACELRQLLDSIAAQSGHSLVFNIVISDNASTDDTRELIADRVAAGMPIVYERLAENRGFDRNILNAVDLASGEFCWLFGSDDIMEPGALANIEEVLRRNPAISGISVGSQGYSADLSRRVVVVDRISTAFSKETVLQGREALVAAMGPWMGYMTGMIVRRSSWQAAIQRPTLEPYLRGYIHLYVITTMLNDRSLWLCLPERLVGCRTGNESFLAKDEFARTRLDIEEFELVFGEVLGRNNWAYRRAISMVAGYFMQAHFLNAKMRGVSLKYWRQAIPMTFRNYWSYISYWTQAVPVAVCPRPLLLLARYVRTRVRQSKINRA